MVRLRLFIAGIVFTSPVWADGATYTYPYYTAASIVNAASYSPQLSENGLVAIFGTNLAVLNGFGSSASSQGGLPLTMSGAYVYIGGIQVGLYYASPTQINLLVPTYVGSGSRQLVVCCEGACGPSVEITLNATAPGLFQDAQNNIIAQHLDGTTITAAAPGKPGEWVVLYCDGLGHTIPDSENYTPPTTAAPIQLMSSFGVLINGSPVDSSAIYYAGVTPGFLGLYQVNLKLPDNITANPEIRLSFGPQSQSIPGTHLFVQTS